MDFYPLEYTSYLTPILAVLGLKNEAKDTDSELLQKKRLIDGEIASKVLATLISINSSITMWDSKKSFTVQALNKVSLSYKNHSWPKRPGEKQSLYSPFNIASPLYSDGIITPLWIAKYKELQPVVIAAFHDLWESIEKDPLHASTVSGLERDYDGKTASENEIKQLQLVQSLW
jgi:hypothetical protein